MSSLNPFALRKSSNSWVIPVSILTLVVGFLTSLAWITQSDRSERLNRLSPDIRSRITSGELDLSEEYQNVRDEVSKLRSEKTRLENLLAKGQSASKEINTSLQELKMFAGITEVEGPGILVTLSDSKRPLEEAFDPAGQAIHDTDVVKVVNELWAAGAEAISVNNKRVGMGTSFRCVGPTILVDGVKIASPVQIRAIGDSETLYGGMLLPGGVLDEIKQFDPKMAKVEVVKKMRMPAFGGSISPKFAEVPKEQP